MDTTHAMAVRRECTTIGHAVVPWTVGASLIALSRPPGLAPGGVLTLVWMPFGARSSRAILLHDPSGQIRASAGLAVHAPSLYPLAARGASSKMTIRP